VTTVTGLTELHGAIAGEVLLPGSPDYESVRRPVMARFHDVHPQAIARCAEPGDVAEAIAFARRVGLEPAVRAGGHDFEGRSSTEGLLVDVSPMRSIAVGDGSVVIGAGARLGDVYDALEPHGLAIAAGCGPTVGIAGLALGGGLGILGRRHGLTCDQVTRAQVVLADGRVVDCDEEHEADLFWALRGAGGCQVGVVTRLELRTVPAPATTTLHLTWPYEHGAAVLEAWQDWAPDAPDELAASLLVTAGADPAEPPRVHVFGALLGTREAAQRQLDAFAGRAGAAPASVELHELPFRAAKRRLAEHGPAEGASPAARLFSRSGFFRQALTHGTVERLLDHLAAGRAPGEHRVLDLTPWGGAYNRVATDATAFAHRRERFLLKHDVAVEPGADVPRARQWLTRSWELAHPSGTARVYPNFPDPELGDPGAAYHGENLERLRRVKAAYDPDGLFGRSLAPPSPPFPHGGRATASRRG
jgi:FAD/FMN-containing dehydrogenase